MIVMCSYCKRRIGEKEPLEDKRLTHGICGECFVKETIFEEVRAYFAKHKTKISKNDLRARIRTALTTRGVQHEIAEVLIDYCWPN